MNYFPLFISLEGQKVLIAGGGRTALHKVRMLKSFGPRMQVIAPQICDAMREEESVECHFRRVKPSDLEGCLLVVAATDESAVNHTLAKLAMEKGSSATVWMILTGAVFCFRLWWKTDP